MVGCVLCKFREVPVPSVSKVVVVGVRSCSRYGNIVYLVGSLGNVIIRRSVSWVMGAIVIVVGVVCGS